MEIKTERLLIIVFAQIIIIFEAKHERLQRYQKEADKQNTERAYHSKE